MLVDSNALTTVAIIVVKLVGKLGVKLGVKLGHTEVRHTYAGKQSLIPSNLLKCQQRIPVSLEVVRDKEAIGARGLGKAFTESRSRLRIVPGSFRCASSTIFGDDVAMSS